MSLMGTPSILDGWPEDPFTRSTTPEHPSRIDDVPIKLTQFCPFTLILNIVISGYTIRVYSYYPDIEHSYIRVHHKGIQLLP